MECYFRTTDERDIHPEFDGERIGVIAGGVGKYIRDYIDKGMYVGFLGILDTEIVCSTALLVYDYPPLFSDKNRKIGHVLNFYTKREFRGKGYSLYKKCGYFDSERCMEYLL